MNKVHLYSAPVRFTHTDPAGFVFFPRFFEMIHASVEDWFNNGLKVNYADLILEKGIGLPTAHTECDFKKPCRLGEQIDFSLDVERIGNTSVSVRFTGRVGGELRLVAKSVLVTLDFKNEKPVKIMPYLREKFSEYLIES